MKLLSVAIVVCLVVAGGVDSAQSQNPPGAARAVDRSLREQPERRRGDVSAGGAGRRGQQREDRRARRHR